MSEEEKIERLLNSIAKGCGGSIADEVKAIIIKQQKEIEELNEIKQQICNEELITQDYVKENFIPKDKIRKAIKNREIELYADNPENDFIPFDQVIDTLKELLEEN